MFSAAWSGCSLAAVFPQALHTNILHLMQIADRGGGGGSVRVDGQPSIVAVCEIVMKCEV